MKLKSTFISHDSGEERILVDASGNFAGLGRGNATAAFIMDCLLEDTTEEAIVDKMCEKYDAPREVIEADVKKIIGKLNIMGAIE